MDRISEHTLQKDAEALGLQPTPLIGPVLLQDLCFQPPKTNSDSCFQRLRVSTLIQVYTRQKRNGTFLFYRFDLDFTPCMNDTIELPFSNDPWHKGGSAV